jgi:sugar transferase (PEP-CTERM/EpsH1 system associated)
MAKVLFLAHRVPYPPNKGDKIRAFHILEHLAARHELWLGACADDPADLQQFAAARATYQDAFIAPLGRVRRIANMLVGAISGVPLSVARFRHPALQRWTCQILRDVRPDIVFVYSSAPAQYVVGQTAPGTTMIVDFVDADAEKWRAYGQSSYAPLSWMYWVESRRLARFDARALTAAFAGILVSETERRLLAGFAPQGALKLHVIANGVDTEFFGLPAAVPGGRSVVLCGRMDYRPNIDGAQWFAREILPKVRAECPDAKFRIVGAEPTQSVLALRSLPGVEVTGAVPDVRPYLSEAAVVVAPLRIARGIQNKVLEGMAAGRPVVATPEALDGIDAEIGVDVLVGTDAASFATAVIDVLLGRAPAELGSRGRRYVLRNHQWTDQLQRLDRLISSALADPSGKAPA